MRIFSHSLIVGIVFLATGIFAQDVRMTLDKPVISLLDRAVLKIEFIDTNGDAVDIPPVDGLQFQYQGQSSQTQINNWERTSKIIHSYVITPSKVGEFTIGPVEVKYKGGSKELSTQLKVIKPTDDKEAQEISELLFSTISTERKNPYVHEPFELDVYVHIRDGVETDGRFGLQGGMPETGINGEPTWEVVGQERKVIDGNIFSVVQLRATVETLTAGTFSFQPQVQLNLVVPRQRRRPFGSSDPFFGDFFGRQEVRPIVLDCNRLDIEVLPIPTDRRPESFTGGIGSFDFDVEVGPKEVKAGEPVTVKMHVRGKGNLKKITAPKINVNGDLKLYEARVLPNENPGEVSFEQVIIPKSSEVKEIPPIEFSFFNTQTADFRTITKGPFPISVEAAPAGQIAKVIATLPSATTPKETRILGRDIVYLKSAPDKWLIESDAHTSHTKLLYFLLSIPAVALIISALFALRRDSLADDTAKARRQKAPKSARKNIRMAEQAMHKKNETAFYEALWNALTEYFGNRLNLAPGEISAAVVVAHFPENRKDDATELQHLFDTIEHRRYGSGGSGSKDEMKTTLKAANRTLKICERMKL